MSAHLLECEACLGVAIEAMLHRPPAVAPSPQFSHRIVSEALLERARPASRATIGVRLAIIVMLAGSVACAVWTAALTPVLTPKEMSWSLAALLLTIAEAAASIGWLVQSAAPRSRLRVRRT